MYKRAENCARHFQRPLFLSALKFRFNLLNSWEVGVCSQNGPPFAKLLSEIRITAEVAEMSAKFDIFKRLPDGCPIWIKAVESLEEAKRQLTQIAAASPGEYFIYNTYEGRVITA